MFGVVFREVNLLVLESPLSGTDGRFDVEGAGLSCHDGVFVGTGSIDGDGSSASTTASSMGVTVVLVPRGESNGKSTIESVTASNTAEMVARVETDNEFVAGEVSGDGMIVTSGVNGTLPEFARKDRVGFVSTFGVVASNGVVDVEGGVDDESLVVRVSTRASLVELSGSKLSVVRSSGNVNLVGKDVAIVFTPSMVLEGNAERARVGSGSRGSTIIYAVFVLVGNRNGGVGNGGGIGNTLTIVADLSLVGGELRLSVDSNGARSTEGGSARNGITGVFSSGSVVSPVDAGSRSSSDDPFTGTVNIRSAVRIDFLDLL